MDNLSRKILTTLIKEKLIGSETALQVIPKEKRQKILQCATDEFASHDFNSASLSKIVARAGIAKGSLYQYFLDKNDLYHYLLDLAAQKKAELLKASIPADPELF